MTPSEIFVAFPEKSKPALYRDLEQLMKIEKIMRVGVPRSKDVRYQVFKQPAVKTVTAKEQPASTKATADRPALAAASTTSQN